MLPDLCLRESYSAHFASHCVNLHVIIYSYHQVTPSQNISAGICHLLSILVLGALNYRHPPPPRGHRRASPMQACTSIQHFGALLPQIWHVDATRQLLRSPLGGLKSPLGSLILFPTLLIFTPLQSSGVAVSIVVTLSLVSLFCPNFSWPTSFFSSYSFILRVTSHVAFSRIPIFPQFHYQH